MPGANGSDGFRLNCFDAGGVGGASAAKSWPLARSLTPEDGLDIEPANPLSGQRCMESCVPEQSPLSAGSASRCFFKFSFGMGTFVAEGGLEVPSSHCSAKCTPERGAPGDAARACVAPGSLEPDLGLPTPVIDGSEVFRLIWRIEADDVEGPSGVTISAPCERVLLPDDA